MRISGWSSDVCSSVLNDTRMICAEPLDRLGIDGDIGGAGDADELAPDARRIGERPHQVEDGAAGERLADRHDALHRGMMVRREEEADAEVGELRGRHFACARHVEAERFQRVGGTRFRGSGAISMLCDRDLTRSEEHTSELQSLMRISYAVFCLKKKNRPQTHSRY